MSQGPLYISLKPFLNHAFLPRPVDWQAVFGNNNPLEVEIGFGNGEYLERLSRQYTKVNFVGFEQYCQRIHRTLRKLALGGSQNNVRVLRLDARAGFERYFNPQTIAQVHCLYPPPWPKKSDVKHRLFTAEFLKLVNSRLMDGGFLKIVTDYDPYIDWIQNNSAGTGFALDYKKIPATYTTKFEKKWVAGGRQEFYELLLTKKEHQHIPLKEDTVLQTYLIEQFDPERFVFKDYSSGGIAVSFKEMLYDAKREIALIHVMASDGPLVQNVRIGVFHNAKGWQVNLAQGGMLMPSQAVARALQCVYEAAIESTKSA